VVDELGGSGTVEVEVGVVPGGLLVEVLPLDVEVQPANVTTTANASTGSRRTGMAPFNPSRGTKPVSVRPTWLRIERLPR
jgi:hypothetical protein